MSAEARLKDRFANRRVTHSEKRKCISFAAIPHYVRNQTKRVCVLRVMAAFEDDDPMGPLPFERTARYWQKAATAYQTACSADTPEVKKLYMEIAMSWATLANELERSVQNPQAVHFQDVRRHH